MKHKLHLQIKSTTKLVLSPQAQQSLFVLQMPILELSAWLRLQIESNPLLQLEERVSDRDCLEEELDFETSSFEVLESLDDSFKTALFPEDFPERFFSIESSVPAPCSLYESLMQQARLKFTCSEALEKAAYIIGNLDHRGFLTETDVDEAILAQIHLFDPPGIAARNLQECLLIQLSLQHKQDTVPYKLIAHHFHDLLANRLQKIALCFHISLKTLRSILQEEIAPLRFQPASSFQSHAVIPLIPDIFVEWKEGKWSIILNDRPLPQWSCAISQEYSKTMQNKPFLAEYTKQIKCLEYAMRRREMVLTAIIGKIIEHNLSFFEGKTVSINPLHTREIARMLRLHLSTVARAIQDKYLSCQWGTYALKSFLSSSIPTTSGRSLSRHSVQQLLVQLIERENKKKPLSDAEICQALKREGILCARRTITKYRHKLSIPAAQHRKRWIRTAA